MESSVELLIGLAILMGLGWCFSCWFGSLISLLFAKDAPCPSPNDYYNYEADYGPSTWKERFPAAQGLLQSPINIYTCEPNIVPVCTLPCLTFSCEYNMNPQGFQLFNNGHTVVLYFFFCTGMRPKISGGPLIGTYQFLHASFRWGDDPSEGSEHSVDCHKHAMELQATYLKENTNYISLAAAVEDGAVVIISYFYQIVDADNPYLEPITKALRKLNGPNTSVEIEPIPMSLLMPPFSCNYIGYCGSLTHPPCSQCVKWIIQPEPLCISYKQVAKFSKVKGCDGPISSNTRPVQNINNRPVVVYR